MSKLKKEKLFGTDGIRGTPGSYPLTEDMLSRIGKSIVYFLPLKKGRRKKLKVIIGKDTRLSGEQIETVLAETLKLCGVKVFLTGIITTPGIAYLTNSLKADMGIMISASHNKAADNGIKFFNANGHKLSHQQEEEIENIIFDNQTFGKVHPRADQDGKICFIRNARTKYVKFLISTLDGFGNLEGMRIALDCAYGAASPFAKKLFKKLGAKVYSINDIPQGENINNGGAIDPASLKTLVLKTQADIGIAIDGDADRGILIDEKGQVLDGDSTIAIIAKYLISKNSLPKNTVVATVMSNYGLKVALKENGGKMIAAEVGDKHVLDALLKNNLTFGGEQSGHIIFLDYLSTPDGLLTALQMLKVMKETRLSLNELSKCMHKFPQILINVKVKEKRPFEKMSVVNERMNYFNNQLKDEGRILLRYSGTESLARVMVEGKNRDLIESIANSLAKEIEQEVGAGTA